MTSTPTSELRVITSAFKSADVDDDTATRVETAALDSGQELRRSAALSTDGQETYLLRLLAYHDGDDLRYAVHHERPEGSELLDSDDRATADAAYEKEAREMQEVGASWDTTDVEDLPTLTYAYTVEAYNGETWRRLGSGTGTLSRHPEWDNDVNEAARTEGADHLFRVEEDNRDAALEKALGERYFDHQPVHTERVRVVVTQDGEEAGSHTWEFEPEEADPNEVERMRKVLRLERERHASRRLS
ncbi:hypothetical protein [Kitasatospora sp. NPDC002965]|uniref:hypothetical protein n=1 Tax=Kitasatospora sp. NPDC002965 TaxID=3154775 RepID=UPI0033BBA55C